MSIFIQLLDELKRKINTPVNSIITIKSLDFIGYALANLTSTSNVLLMKWIQIYILNCGKESNSTIITTPDLMKYENVIFFKTSDTDMELNSELSQEIFFFVQKIKLHPKLFVN